MPIPVKGIGLTVHGRPPRQIPVAVYSKATGVWSIWIAYNRDMSAGTFVRLLPNGTATIDTIQPDEQWTSFPIGV